MEQKRQEREAEETDFRNPNIPTLCANNCGFFGSSATNNLCSKCYKDCVLSKSKAAVVEPIAVPAVGKSRVEEVSSGADGYSEKRELFEIGHPSSGEEASGAAAAVVEGSMVVVEEAVAKKPKNRCGFCNKRVGLMGFKCRCGELFCSLHRYSDKHGCLFDYKVAGQDAIAKANPVVKADKVEKI